VRFVGIDVKVCFGDARTAVQDKVYDSRRGEILDKEKGRETDPFKGTVPDVRGFPSSDTLTNNGVS
jgi:hypothetical protein